MQEEHKGKTIEEISGLKIISCEKCGFMHVLPYPPHEEVAEFYSKKFFEEKKLYIKRFLEDIEWWETLYYDRYSNFEKLFESKEKRKILDIGSGFGFFLKHGKEKGWDVLGIEPSIKAAEFSRKHGITIINDFFQNVDLKKYAPFDVIHISEVLEHIPYPLDVLKKAHSLLKKEGVVCVCVPNDFNKFQLLLKKKSFDPYWISPKDHVNYFDIESLSKLIEKAGFNVAIKDVQFPMEFFLLMGENYVGNDELGRKCHAKRKKWDIILANEMPSFRKEFYKFLAKQGLGRECVIYAKKE